jgi:hypothetical protein
MINETALFLILRILTLIPSLILTILQGKILCQKWGNSNGMRPYRILLFLFTLAFACDNAIVAYGDFLKLFFNINHGDTFNDITYVRYIARLVELTAIYYFYKLIYIKGK